MNHFLCVHDSSAEELGELLTLSAELKRRYKQGTLKRSLEGKVLAMIFEKASLRTRMSFQIAMFDLGGTGISLKPDDIGILGQREPIKDVARVIGRYVHGIMCRTFSHQTLKELAEHAGVPVINALSDWSHPCQAMADVLTIREHLGALAGKKIAFVHPENTHGVLVELYELTAQEPQIRLARARRLADRVLSGGQNMASAALAFLRRVRDNGNNN